MITQKYFYVSSNNAKMMKLPIHNNQFKKQNVFNLA